MCWRLKVDDLNLKRPTSVGCGLKNTFCNLLDKRFSVLGTSSAFNQAVVFWEAPLLTSAAKCGAFRRLLGGSRFHFRHCENMSLRLGVSVSPACVELKRLDLRRMLFGSPVWSPIVALVASHVVYMSIGLFSSFQRVFFRSLSSVFVHVQNNIP